MKKALSVIACVCILFLSGCNKKNDKTSEQLYTLKEQNNQVVLMQNGKVIETTDIVITSLPREEIMKIKKGIKTKSYKTAKKLIENYES